MTEQTLLICPACQAKNRVPNERLQPSMLQAANCGKCQTALLAVAPLVLDGPLFKRLLAHETLPLVVDFWAPWCGPCQQMAPTFATAAKQMAGKLRFAKLDTEAHPTPAAQWGIRSIPTLIAFSHGKEIARQSGALSAGQLQQWLNSLAL